VNVILAVVVGSLFAIGLYLMMRRSIVRLIIGLAIASNAANLLIFTAGGLTRGRPPLVPEGATVPAGAIADPLPQAMILTAIVIGFGVLAFMLVLVRSVVHTVGTDDLDRMRATDR
jgi:multicomponent Na+:H+ antiporter subunit C